MVVNDQGAAIYPSLTSEQQDAVEVIVAKGPGAWTQDDWQELLEILQEIE